MTLISRFSSFRSCQSVISRLRILILPNPTLHPSVPGVSSRSNLFQLRAVDLLHPLFVNLLFCLGEIFICRCVKTLNAAFVEKSDWRNTSSQSIVQSTVACAAFKTSEQNPLTITEQNISWYKIEIHLRKFGCN